MAENETPPASQDELQDFDKLFDYAKPEATEAKLRTRLLQAHEEGAKADYAAQLLSQVARTLALQKRFEDGHAVLDEAEGLLTPGCVLGRIRCRLERGRLFQDAGDAAQALAPLEEAVSLAETAGASFHAVDAAHMLGLAATPEVALTWNEKAIALAEATRSERTRSWLGPLYNNTGWTYLDNGDHEKALGCFEKSLAYRVEQGNAKQALIAQWTIGRTLRAMGRYEEALEQQHSLLDAYEKAGQKSGFVYEEIGEILWAKGQKSGARSWLRGAYTLLSEVPWMKERETERLNSLAVRGHIDEAPGSPS